MLGRFVKADAIQFGFVLKKLICRKVPIGISCKLRFHKLSHLIQPVLIGMDCGGGEHILKNLGILGVVFPGVPELLVLQIEITSGNGTQVVVAEVVAEIVIADIRLGVMDMLDVSADCMTIIAIRQLGRGAIAVKISDSFFMAEIPQKSIVSPLGQIGLIVDISASSYYGVSGKDRI